MAANSIMKGARLEFVLRPHKGQAQSTHKFNKKTRKVEASAPKPVEGFMLYLPSGQAHFLTTEQVEKKNFGRKPQIINFDKVNDTTSPVGRFKFGVDQEERASAYKDMEQEIIRLCTRRGSFKQEVENDHADAA